MCLDGSLKTLILMMAACHEVQHVQRLAQTAGAGCLDSHTTCEDQGYDLTFAPRYMGQLRAGNILGLHVADDAISSALAGPNALCTHDARERAGTTTFPLRGSVQHTLCQEPICARTLSRSEPPLHSSCVMIGGHWSMVMARSQTI